MKHDSGTVEQQSGAANPAERIRALEARVTELTAERDALSEYLAETDARTDRLKARLENLNHLAESLPFTFYVFDRSTQENIWSNRHIAKDLGYTPDEIKAMGDDFLPKLLHPDDLQALPGLLKRWDTVKDGEIISTLYRMKNAGGEWRWYLGQDVVYRRDADGTVQQFMGTAIDIDDRMKAEEERRSLERQMFHSQKLESLGVLAGGIAHDFNNLLVSILGYADLARDEASETVRKEYLDEVKNGAQRASELANLMLAYSGKGRVQKAPIAVNDVIAGVSDLMRAAISKKAQLVPQFTEDLPLVDGDVTQIRQVIMNLITNASEAIGDQAGTIGLITRLEEFDHDRLSELGMDAQVEPGAKVVIEVSDTGCGIKPEDRKRLFDPFFTTKRSGRGLGMSAVLGIVRSHRGAIAVTSTLGKGTTFTVLLPASGHQRDADDGTNDADASAQLKQSSKTVLVVDDEESVRRLCDSMLKRLGHRALLAEDGVQAIATLQTDFDSIDAVVLDMTMPHMDGKECLRRIRETHASLPVILTSGFTLYDIEAETENDRHLTFIQKPYDFAAFENKLKELLLSGDA